MKHLIILLILLILTASCSIEQRFKKLIYTNELYYTDTKTYQVYMNSKGERYIIILNKKETNFKKHYLK